MKFIFKTQKQQPLLAKLCLPTLTNGFKYNMEH